MELDVRTLLTLVMSLALVFDLLAIVVWWTWGTYAPPLTLASLLGTAAPSWLIRIERSARDVFSAGLTMRCNSCQIDRRARFFMAGQNPL
jgi:hypothetical protein